jgi:hypothetical protein
VDYAGKYDGEGLMWRRWNVGGFHGPWLIRLGHSSDASDVDIEALIAKLELTGEQLDEAIGKVTRS